MDGKDSFVGDCVFVCALAGGIMCMEVRVCQCVCCICVFIVCFGREMAGLALMSVFTKCPAAANKESPLYHEHIWHAL